MTNVCTLVISYNTLFLVADFNPLIKNYEHDANTYDLLNSLKDT